MICINFSHELFDAPYNQKAVKKALKELDQYLQSINEKQVYSFGTKRGYLGFDDEVVVVYHTNVLTVEQKEVIANKISASLTLLKANEEEMGDKCVIFNKIESDNVYLYEMK